jgi:glycine oxidase
MGTVADVIVVGAGVIGAMSAWRLAGAGLKVRVLERGAPGSEASQAAIGLLSPHVAPDDEPAFGVLARASAALYPTMLAEVEEVTGQRPEFRRCGRLAVVFEEAEMAWLDDLYRINVNLDGSVELATGEELRLFEPGLNPEVLGGVFFPEEARVDNTALTFAAMEAAKASGAKLERVAVTAIERGSEGHMVVKAHSRQYMCEWVVLAAGAWSGGIAGVPSLPVEPVKGQALAVAGQPLRHIVGYSHGYAAPRGTDQTLIGATAERVGYDQTTTLDGLRHLTALGLKLAPGLAKGEFMGAWAGLRPGSADGMPYIGPFAEFPNVIAATGHFRDGILLAPVTAELVRDLITNQPLAVPVEPYLPGRTVA